MFIKCPLVEQSREEDDECWNLQSLWPKGLCLPLCKASLPASELWALCTNCVLSPSQVSGWALPKHCRASGCAFYWYSVFCAVLLWPILKEVCLALVMVLNRSEIANGPDYNFNHNNDTFSTEFSGMELIWSFPPVKAKLLCVPVHEVSGFGCSGHGTGRHSDCPSPREPQGSPVPCCWLSFGVPWCKARRTTVICMQLLWSLLPLCCHLSS